MRYSSRFFGIGLVVLPLLVFAGCGGGSGSVSDTIGGVNNPTLSTNPTQNTNPITRDPGGITIASNTGHIYKLA